MDAQTVGFQAAYARLRRACATCGWSRSTRHSGGPERANEALRKGPVLRIRSEDEY